MDEDSAWHDKEQWFKVGLAALGGVLGSQMIDHYGWADGFLRAVAVVLLINLPVRADWAKVREAGIGISVPLAGLIFGCVLYLVATFGFGERGPGGTLCVAALVLSAMACAVLARGSSASA